MRDKDAFWKAVREELATYTGKKLEKFIEEYNKTVPEEYKLISKQQNPPSLRGNLKEEG